MSIPTATAVELAFATLQQAVDSAKVPPAPKTRATSRMAKNIRCGDVVDLPYFGTVEIAAWSRNGEHVLLGDGGNKNVTVGAEQRLRVYRA